MLFAKKKIVCPSEVGKGTSFWEGPYPLAFASINAYSHISLKVSEQNRFLFLKKN
jgi:hypothetical protein